MNLRVLHIVAFASPTGEYGGPTRVADNLAVGLSELGEQVLLISTNDSKSKKVNFTEFPIQIFNSFSLIKKNRFGTLFSPSLLFWLFRNASQFDLVHIHISRDFITLPASFICRVRKVKYVVQPHGMILPKTQRVFTVFDKFFTLPALNHARKIYYLSAQEKQGLVSLGVDSSQLMNLQNGLVSVPQLSTTQTSNASDILFLARLASRKRPMLLLKATAILVEKIPTLKVAFVGPDEGELASLMEFVSKHKLSQNVHFEGPLAPNKVIQRMKNAKIYVLPAVDEPFGMTIIESLFVGVPVILTQSAALATYLLEKQAGIVVPDDDPVQLAEAIMTLLNDHHLRAILGGNGKTAVQDDFSIEKISKSLAKSYREATK